MDILRRPTETLRLALRADAAIVAVAGLALAIGANPVGDLLDLDPTLLRTMGITLLPWAGWVGWVSQHPTIATVRSVIAGNLLWVITSAMVLVLRVLEPNGLGIAFVLLQAAMVAILACWQYREVRPPFA